MHDFLIAISRLPIYVDKRFRYQNDAQNTLHNASKRPERVHKLDFDWLLVWYLIKQTAPLPSSTANHSTPCKSISGAISSCTWLATRGFSASTRIHRGVASFTMGKRKDRRQYSSRKRKFCGNQHSSGVSRGKRQKLSETEAYSYSAAEIENST